MAGDAAPRPVVVGTDGSPSATHAVRWAAREAELDEAPLSIVYACSLVGAIPSAGARLDHGTAAVLGGEVLAEAAVVAEEVAPKLPISTRLSHATPTRALIGLSSTARMVVVGSWGLHSLAGPLGATAIALAAHGDCPLTVVRGPHRDAAPPTHGPVVVGFDGSRAGDAATALAFLAASARGAHLVAVHAPLDGGRTAADRSIDWQQVEYERRRWLVDLLAPYRVEYPDVVVRCRVDRQGPVRALLREATDARLVVVGARGSGGPRGLLLGSTARALLQRSPCPVAVVPVRW